MKPLVLCIMDGFGHSDETKGNAVAAAKTPNLDRLFANCPNCLIGASGMDVGLPDGQMGNSEVGHTNIGAGRIVYQELTRITKAVDDGSFFENRALCAAMDNAAAGHALHLMGLCSDGGVHSHNDHLYALLEMAKRRGLSRVYVHCFMDGRDVPPASGKEYVEKLEAKMKQIGTGRIATVMGRYYAMDRDNRWDREKKAYDAMVLREGAERETASEAMQHSYDDGVTDEFVIPAVIRGGEAVASGDSVIFYNFRPDRARQLTRAFVDPDFSGFVRKNGFFPLTFVCFAQYDASMPNVLVAFPPESLENTFGEIVSERGLHQLRIAETEKYAHVTFFFNGGKEAPYPGEDRALIHSPKVATYDLQPQMSAPEVCDEMIRRIDSGLYDVIILNFANCDMVGHTGVFSAAVAAVETVDTCVGRIADELAEKGGAMLLTADHGNAEKMLDENGEPFTAHTTNPVPFLVFGVPGARLASSGRLADIAPTMLKLMGIPQPAEMTGKSLIL